MPSIYVISQYVAYQNSVRLVEFMPFTTAFHPSLYNSCLIVNPWARLMLIIVKTMFIERKKKKNKQSRFPWFTQAETSRPCAERISTPSTLTELTAFLKKKKKKRRRIQTTNTLWIFGTALSVFSVHTPLDTTLEYVGVNLKFFCTKKPHEE